MSGRGLIDAALAIAASGWPVFACLANKAPATGKGGLHLATRDPNSIRAQFLTSGAAMIGAPTGEISGIDAVDIDPKNDGHLWFKGHEHLFPRTRVHQTGSGGRHYLLQHAPGIRNSAGRIGQGVDVRGDGGYVIVPPSPGYVCISDAPLAHWPDELLAKALPPERSEERPSSGPRDPIPAKRIDAFVEAVLARVRNAVNGQKHFVLRNASLSLGGIADQAGITEKDAIDWLLAALPSAENWQAARKTAEWGFQSGRSRPLNLPDRMEKTPRNESRRAPPDPGTSEAKGYAIGAVRQAIRRVMRAAEIDQGKALRQEALSLSRFVKVGTLTRDEIVAALEVAGSYARMPSDKVTRTIAAALDGDL